MFSDYENVVIYEWISGKAIERSSLKTNRYCPEQPFARLINAILHVCHVRAVSGSGLSGLRHGL